jgi:hypothetical protein
VRRGREVDVARARLHPRRAGADRELARAAQLRAIFAAREVHARARGHAQRRAGRKRVLARRQDVPCALVSRARTHAAALDGGLHALHRRVAFGPRLGRRRGRGPALQHGHADAHVDVLAGADRDASAARVFETQAADLDAIPDLTAATAAAQAHPGAALQDRHADLRVEPHFARAGDQQGLAGLDGERLLALLCAAREEADQRARLHLQLRAVREIEHRVRGRIGEHAVAERELRADLGRLPSLARRVEVAAHARAAHFGQRGEHARGRLAAASAAAARGRRGAGEREQGAQAFGGSRGGHLSSRMSTFKIATPLFEIVTLRRCVR